LRLGRNVGLLGLFHFAGEDFATRLCDEEAAKRKLPSFLLSVQSMAETSQAMF